jgi:hypothetical protein
MIDPKLAKHLSQLNHAATALKHIDGPWLKSISEQVGTILDDVSGSQYGGELLEDDVLSDHSPRWPSSVQSSDDGIGALVQETDSHDSGCALAHLNGSCDVSTLSSTCDGGPIDGAR